MGKEEREREGERVVVEKAAKQLRVEHRFSKRRRRRKREGRCEQAERR